MKFRLGKAGCGALLRRRRKSCCIVRLNGVHVRDQARLYDKHMRLTHGWSLEDFVEHLNGFVFFWPGNEERPVCSGDGQRYASECPAEIRVCLADLFAGNSSPSRFNSGAPRSNSKTGKSPRGRDTFIPGDEFGSAFGSPRHAVEVVFRKWAKLPPTSQVARLNGDCGWALRGEWQPLFSQG